MVKIGVTGGIGVGKTSVVKLIEGMGIPVFYSDIVAREGEYEPEIKEELIKILGSDVFENGIINRTKMRNIAFNDKTILAKISAIIDPYVIKRFEMFLKEHESAEFVVLESALLFEHNLSEKFDYVISVVADMNVRLDRVIKRDNITKELFETKLAIQVTDDVRRKLSDYIIDNSNTNMDVEYLQNEINRILDDIKEKTNTTN